MSSREWEKVLWKKHPYPDNYIPHTFLSSLRKNTNFKPYTYWPLVLAACSITQHLSTVFIFLATFIRIYDGSWDPRYLVWSSVAIFLLGYVIWEVLEYKTLGYLVKHADRAKTFKSSILVFLALMALSPVLRTLTAATSSDSIWALAACLFILNVLLADYGSLRPYGHTRDRLTSVLSMNAAISSSVVLASRLRDDLSVFALILFSVQLFALYPLVRTRLQVTDAFTYASITIFLPALSIYLHSSPTNIITLILGIVLVFITFVAPALLLWAQSYKNEIRGPWDVAVPQINTADH
ncbi:phosphatidylinositol N-acetylglucosaminyltransferase [Rickenella mellea]|uniref:Phosphatidylinositol N-acetylglucosaminyltransferase n=1 Tax=Rickenella mellea TaxID=50990 RepID=A0A4Y7QM33_9AGAM|nr:phosphatidylinositol N-acetylglucosaminyltransferase [Rickenella mellea]